MKQLQMSIYSSFLCGIFSFSLLLSCDIKKNESCCSLDDLEKQELVSECKLCHTNEGLKGYSQILTYRELCKINELELRNKLIKIKKSDNHKFIDTLSIDEINCLIQYMGNFKDIQP